MSSADNINKLGLGAAGTGGDTVCLAVKIGTAATHTAIAPVAINFHCWVARRAGIRMYNDGRIEKASVISIGSERRSQPYGKESSYYAY